MKKILVALTFLFCGIVAYADSGDVTVIATISPKNSAFQSIVRSTNVYVSTAAFSKNLAAADVNLQHAMETIDQLSTGGGGSFINNQSTIQASAVFYVSSGTVSGATSSAVFAVRSDNANGLNGDATKITIETPNTISGATNVIRGNSKNNSTFLDIIGQNSDASQQTTMNFTNRGFVSNTIDSNGGLSSFSNTFGQFIFVSTNAFGAVPEGTMTVDQYVNNSNPIMTVTTDDGSNNLTDKFIVTKSTVEVTTQFVVDGATVSINGVSYNWPTADGSAGQFLKTNGSKTLSFATASGGGGGGGISTINTLTNGATNFVYNQDTLQANTTFYVSSGTVQGQFTVTGATLAINGLYYNWPTTDGSAGQFLKTNGSKTLSFASAGGGGISTINTLTNGATNFIFNQTTLQANSTFYVSSATVQGTLLSKANGQLVTPLTVMGAPSQAVDLLDFEKNDATVLTSFDSNSHLHLTATGTQNSDPAINFGSNFGFYTNSNRLFFQTSSWKVFIIDNNPQQKFGKDTRLCWSQTSNDPTDSADIGFSRTSAGVLTLNGADTTTNGSLVMGAATSSTLALTIKAAASQTADLTTWNNSSALKMLRVLANGVIDSTGTIPVLTSCGTGPVGLSGSSDQAGTITAGTGSTGCTVSFIGSYSNTPSCIVTQQTGSVTNTFSYTVSNSAITVSEVGLGTGKFDYECRFHEN